MTFTGDDLRLWLQTLGEIALVLLFLRWYEPRMIYYPHIPTRRIERTPESVGLIYEAVTLTTSDGLHLSGWWLPADDPQAPVVLFFHGNAGNISHGLEKDRILHDLGLSVFVLDYRGYGESEGRPGERGMYRDADAAYAYLTQQRGIKPESLILYGESLGTGVAVDLASRVPVAGVILEAAYTSLAHVGQRIFWFLPFVIHLLVRNRYDSLRKIAKLRIPLLLLHSENDEIFRYRLHATRLFAAAREPKCLVPLRGTHADAFFTSSDTTRNAIQPFLASLSPSCEAEVVSVSGTPLRSGEGAGER